ncbi:MAG: hypothetical protein AAF085_06645 [Planctomycetota bacterium]
MSDHATLVQSLLESDIISAEEATLFSRPGEGNDHYPNRPRSESSESVLKKLESMGRLSKFQIDLIESDGPAGLQLGDYCSSVIADLRLS